MAGRKISLLVLAVFIVGTFLLIYIQYNASKNISNLIDGNELLLKEFTVNTTLLDMEKEIAAVENIVRETMITNDRELVSGIRPHQQKITAGVAQLLEITKNDSSSVYINALQTLVQRKLAFSARVLDSFQVSGREAARKLMITGESRRLSDSILQVTQKIDNIREQHLSAIIALMDQGGQKAQQLGLWLVILVLVSAAGFLWYIVTIIRKQISLIGQLDASEKKVREAALMKEKFMADMSHEIRTPMVAILGITRLLQQKRLDQESAGQVNIIRQASENLLSISNDVLDLSKIEAGKLTIEKEPFNIRTILQTIVGLLQPKITEKQLQLLITVDETVPETLEGDANRLTQILMNLAGNAIKFTKQGSITVKVSNEGLSDGVVMTGISVTDTGIGIEKEKQPYVFERFHQLGHDIPRKYGGAGLGLAIVKELVTLQQGTITVESEPGKGTTFLMRIPYRIADTGMPVPEAPPEEAVSPDDTKDIRLLLVDDDPVNLHIQQLTIQTLGLQVDTAAGGKEAIDKLQVSAYDLVFMDLNMPDMSGFEATQYIRHSLHSGIPVVALTADAFTSKEECIEHGMNDRVLKPVTLQELNRIIQQYTASRKQLIPVDTNGTASERESYQIINLDYMREVGAGNRDYEQNVTEQFLEAMPAALKAMDDALSAQDISRIQHLAHNMRTTISVMGLNERLQPFLDQLEYETLSTTALQNNILALKETCEAAIAEAKQFYAGLIIH